MTCSLCGSDTESCEVLCASCLADPGERVAYERIARAAAAASSMARYFAYAHHALLLARTYAVASGPNDPRVLACVDEVRRCRDEIHALRARAPRPGLHKTAPAKDAAVRSRAAR